MRIITLIPLTKRAKQHGERGEAIRSEPRVLFTDLAGPWLYVQPLTEERAPATDPSAARIESAARWVHEFNDENFKVAP